MEKDSWKALFSFSRRERIGVMLLLLGVAIAFIWPCFLSSPASAADEQLALEWSQRLAADTGNELNKGPGEWAVAGDGAEQNSFGAENPGRWERNEYGKEKGRPITPVLFSFDPNTISAAEWRRLGLKERTVRTVMHYIAKGGKFRRAEDLRKIYGLPAGLSEKLVPFVKIAAVAVADSAVRRHDAAASNGEGRGAAWRNSDRDAPHDHPVFRGAGVDAENRSEQVGNMGAKVRWASAIDINQADSVAWEALPGIGGRLAQRILRFREKLGGFYSVDQLADIYGLPDSVFRRLRPLLSCEGAPLKKININTAAPAELKQHPYMSWNMANSIVQYRRQHGLFRSASDLDKIAITDTGVLKKIRPYLEAE